MGVDVGAKAEIYEMLNQGARRRSGGAAGLVGSLTRLQASAIVRLIFNRGQIVQELRRSDLSVARLTALVGAPRALGVG